MKTAGEKGQKLADLITRQEACKRLTRAAIAVFVRGDEPLMAHLAVQAALRVCRDVVRARDPSEDQFGKLIRPEMEREFWKHHAKIANFLKHAERDPSQTLDVSNINALNEHIIFMCCGYYWDAFPGKVDVVMWTFAQWYKKKHPEAQEDNQGRSDASDAFATEERAWSMLQTACSLGPTELAQMAEASPKFDW